VRLSELHLDIIFDITAHYMIIGGDIIKRGNSSSNYCVTFNKMYWKNLRSFQFQYITGFPMIG